MSEGNSLINVDCGDLSKAATALIQQISKAVGGFCKPWQIHRVAQAEADAAIIKTQAQIETTDLQRRALRRFIAEEEMKQRNIEAITIKALPDVKDDAKPEQIEPDWITNFFDKCRLVSDEQMQTLWAKILAGEANQPGKICKHTLHVLALMDKSDAEKFLTLHRFCWDWGSVMVPIIHDEDADIFKANGLNRSTLIELTELGLVDYDGIKAKYMPAKHFAERKFSIFYNNTTAEITFSEPEDAVNIGKVFLTKAGNELAPICKSEPVPGYFEFVIDQWKKNERKGFRS